MVIKIELYDEDCEHDVSGYKPKLVYHCCTLEEAEMALGLIGRQENIPVVDAVDF